MTCIENFIGPQKPKCRFLVLPRSRIGVCFAPSAHHFGHIRSPYEKQRLNKFMGGQFNKAQALHIGTAPLEESALTQKGELTGQGLTTAKTREVSLLAGQCIAFLVAGTNWRRGGPELRIGRRVGRRQTTRWLSVRME